MLDGGADSLASDRVEHRTDEQRIAAGRRLQGRAEGLVRLETVQLACEHRDRVTAKRFGQDRNGFRIGDELCDEHGIAALALRRTGCSGHEQGHSSSLRVK